MPWPNRPKFNRRDPHDYLVRVQHYAGKLLAVLHGFVTVRHGGAVGKMPSDQLIEQTIGRLPIAMLVLHDALRRKGAQLPDLVEDVDACIADLEALVKRCGLSERVTMRGDFDPK